MAYPNSTVWVCSGVPLDPRYEHTLTYADKTLQRSYFEGKAVRAFSSVSYLRKSKSIKLPAKFADAALWNYLFTDNSLTAGVDPNGVERRYYYFITDVQYVNDYTVEVFLELDVMQTYMFDYELLPCFVERTHVASDKYGEHTIDEGLELGDPVIMSAKHTDNTNWLDILVLASINPNYSGTGSPVKALASLYDGVFSGLKVWQVDLTRWTEWEDKLAALEEAGFLDGIHDMWMYPRNLIECTSEITTDVAYPVNNSKAADATMPGCPETLDGYTPKNRKLFTYPYTFLHCSNNNGGSAVYRFERFDDGAAYPSFFEPDVTETYFKMYGTVSPDASVILAPENYNGQSVNLEECLSLNNYPHCAWDSDTFKMWLAQNQNQQDYARGVAGVKAVGGAAVALGSLFGGNLAGAAGGAAMAISGATQIGEMMAQRRDMEIQPPQARGTFSSTAAISAGKHNFTFYVKSIPAEMAACIDDYFTMYGYKMNRVMYPLTTARENFTYIKTVNCHIKATLPAADIVKIESIFDRGVTFWKNPENVGDYSVSNRPATEIK